MGSQDHKRTRTYIERVTKPSAPEPVAGPSWADPDVGESYAQPEDIDDTAASLSSLSLSSEPQVFSPLSFTPSPTKDHVFQFPSPQEGLDQQSSQGEDIDESDPEDEPSGDDSDPDEKSDDESEDAPDFLVIVSGHASCVFGCHPNDLTVIPDSIRAEILVLFQIFIPKGARSCRAHRNEPYLRPLSTTDETITSA